VPCSLGNRVAENYEGSDRGVLGEGRVLLSLSSITTGKIQPPPSSESVCNCYAEMVDFGALLSYVLFLSSDFRVYA